MERIHANMDTESKLSVQVVPRIINKSSPHNGGPYVNNTGYIFLEQRSPNHIVFPKNSIQNKKQFFAHNQVPKLILETAIQAVQSGLYNIINIDPEKILDAHAYISPKEEKEY